MSTFTWGRNYPPKSKFDLAPAASAVDIPVSTVAVSAGYAHSVALADGGAVFTWGDNAEGQLGRRGPLDKPLPVAGFHDEPVVAIAAGALHSAAVSETGGLYQWGLLFDEFDVGGGTGSGGDGSGAAGGYGLAGMSSRLSRNEYLRRIVLRSEAAYIANRDIREVSTEGTGKGSGSAGASAASAASAGTVGGAGTAAAATTTTVSATDVLRLRVRRIIVPRPRLAAGLDGTRIVAVACGYAHTLALASDGSMWAAGYNDRGQLGLNHRIASATFKRLGTEPGSALARQVITRIACGQQHNLACSADGLVFAWGSGALGQLGNERTGDLLAPRIVEALATGGHAAVDVACGSNHSLVLTAAGNVFGFGHSEYQQLASGADFLHAAAPRYYYIPRLLLGPGSAHRHHRHLRITRLAAGGQFSLALLEDGTAISWGWDAYRCLGRGVGTPQETSTGIIGRVAGLQGQRVVAVACGYNHGLAAVAHDGHPFASGWLPVLRALNPHLLPVLTAASALPGAVDAAGTVRTADNSLPTGKAGALLALRYMNKSAAPAPSTSAGAAGAASGDDSAGDADSHSAAGAPAGPDGGASGMLRPYRPAGFHGNNASGGSAARGTAGAPHHHDDDAHPDGHRYDTHHPVAGHDGIGAGLGDDEALAYGDTASHAALADLDDVTGGDVGAAGHALQPDACFLGEALLVGLTPAAVGPATSASAASAVASISSALVRPEMLLAARSKLKAQPSNASAATDSTFGASVTASSNAAGTAPAPATLATPSDAAVATSSAAAAASDASAPATPATDSAAAAVSASPAPAAAAHAIMDASGAVFLHASIVAARCPALQAVMLSARAAAEAADAAEVGMATLPGGRGCPPITVACYPKARPSGPSAAASTHIDPLGRGTAPIGGAGALHGADAPVGASHAIEGCTWRLSFPGVRRAVLYALASYLYGDVLVNVPAHRLPALKALAEGLGLHRLVSLCNRLRHAFDREAAELETQDDDEAAAAAAAAATSAAAPTAQSSSPLAAATSPVASPSLSLSSNAHSASVFVADMRRLLHSRVLADLAITVVAPTPSAEGGAGISDGDVAPVANAADAAGSDPKDAAGALLTSSPGGTVASSLSLHRHVLCRHTYFRRCLHGGFAEGLAASVDPVDAVTSAAASDAPGGALSLAARITLRDLEPLAFLETADYLYTGDDEALAADGGRCLRVLTCAARFCMPDVVARAQDIIVARMTPADAPALAEVADALSLPRLARLCSKLIAAAPAVASGAAAMTTGGSPAMPSDHATSGAGTSLLL